jgi:hypothetical protein
MQQMPFIPEWFHTQLMHWHNVRIL